MGNMTISERRKVETLIKWQVFHPRITPLHACPNECGRSARSGGKCAECLAGDDRALQAFVMSCRESVRALWVLEESGEA
jgi:hypothetical protein